MMRTRQHVTRGLFTLSVASAYAIGVSSCVLQRAPPRSEVVGKALPSTTTIPPGWTPAETISQDVVNNWVKTFNDAGLEAIVNEAIAHNSDLRKAAATVEVARQSAELGGARLKPQAGCRLEDRSRKTRIRTTRSEATTSWCRWPGSWTSGAA